MTVNNPVNQPSETTTIECWLCSRKVTVDSIDSDTIRGIMERKGWSKVQIKSGVFVCPSNHTPHTG